MNSRFFFGAIIAIEKEEMRDSIFSYLTLEWRRVEVWSEF